MRIIQKIASNLLLVAAFFFAFVCAVFAQTTNKGADFLVQVGVNEYEKGNIPGAIHEFSKALMLEPDNEKALYYLNQLGIDRGLYPGAATTTTQIAQLGQSVASYRQHTEQLELERQTINAKVNELRDEVERLKTMNTEKDRIIERLEHSLDHLSAASDKTKGKEQPLKERIETVMADRHAEDKTVPVDSGAVEISRAKRAFEAIEAHELDPDDLDRLTESEALSLEQYEYHNRLIHVLEDYLNLREQSLAYAQDDLTETQIDLARHGALLLDKVHEVETMAESYNRYLKRVGNEEFVVGEEERYLKALRSRLEDSRADISGQRATIGQQTQELAFLQHQLKAAKERIEDLLKERERFLKAVKKEAADIRALD